MRRPGLPTILPAVVGVVLMVGMHCFQSSILAQDRSRRPIADVSWKRTTGGDGEPGTALTAAPPEPAPPRTFDALPEEPYTAALGPEGDSDSDAEADLPYDPIAPDDPAATPATPVIASRETPATPWAAQAEASPRRAPRQADVSTPAPAVEGRVLADPALTPAAPEAPATVSPRETRPYDPIEPLDASTPEADLAAEDEPADARPHDPGPLAAFTAIDDRPAPSATPAEATQAAEAPLSRPAPVEAIDPAPAATPALAVRTPDLPAVASRAPRPMVVRPIEGGDDFNAPVDDADRLTASPARDENHTRTQPVPARTPRAPSVAASDEPLADPAAAPRRETEVNVQPVIVARPSAVTVEAPSAKPETQEPELLASVARDEPAETPPSATAAAKKDDQPRAVVLPKPTRRVDDEDDTHPTEDRNLMLMMALQDPDKYVRKWAVEMLGGTGDKRAVRPLIRRLGDSDWWVRRAAMYSLMQLGDDAAIKPITQRLRKGSWKDQQVAAMVLGKMDATSAVPALMVQLGTADDRVRVACAAALGQIGDDRAVSALRKALADGSKSVRLAAKRALKRIAQAKVVSR